MGIGDKLFKMKNEKAVANLKAGQDFLEENRKKPGVHVLPSGLQYEIISTGDGPKPLATNTVTCHYHGTLIDGTVFDSSVRRGQPASFPLNMVIKGWTEALQLMPVGSKWRLFLPPQLAYGDRQTGSHIGPNSTLIFEVELLGIA
jgi:FKBP-type peptidyl-prolyl cis-trans isomerase FklB